MRTEASIPAQANKCSSRKGKIKGKLAPETC